MTDTNLDLKALAELEKAATPGPWVPYWKETPKGEMRLNYVRVPRTPGSEIGTAAMVMSPRWSERQGELDEIWIQMSKADVDFITQWRENAAALLALVEAQNQRIKSLEAGLDHAYRFMSDDTL